VITTYIELTLRSDDTKHLIPIEAVRRVGEHITLEYDSTALPSSKKVKICRLLVEENTWDVVETYSEVKDQINKIARALRVQQFTTTQNEQR
jgi:hypothetical protein